MLVETDHTVLAYLIGLGLGAMIGVELVHDRQTRGPWVEGVQHVLATTQEKSPIVSGNPRENSGRELV